MKDFIQSFSLRLAGICIVLFCISCSIVAWDKLDSLYGKENATTREGSLTPEQIKS